MKVYDITVFTNVLTKEQIQKRYWRINYVQGINRGIKLACWVLSDDRVLPKVIGVYLSAEEYKELLEYKHMYENLCK